ncbi:DUF894 domain-containing protein [Naegleria gruberi]|uniref:DUF894 domain-containing protein n=1 Tax=Naegleria gruberi TaxID=5762 RepID=D2VJQ1_NAEGR|nr:DUF894 domain-containing protein [Naegleria gruberi]EFC42992.1 DUF894 domain-containing protein [Naegleria gruberi]|eukprot:XP_002675736.1 DUF894 domain-containing protein [Naegleria gruberi strain NEG-M]
MSATTTPTTTAVANNSSNSATSPTVAVKSTNGSNTSSNNANNSASDYYVSSKKGLANNRVESSSSGERWNSIELSDVAASGNTSTIPASLSMENEQHSDDHHSDSTIEPHPLDAHTHTIGNYAQLDQESSKPKLARNPYISLLFHNKRFLIIWMAGVLSGMGNYFSEIGIVYEVEERTTVGFVTSGVFISIFLPSCVATPFAGVVSDIFDRRKVLIVCNFLRAILAFVLVAGPFITNTNALFGFYYTILAMIFFINAFYDASRGCMMPLCVDHNDLVACNALDSLTWLFCSYTGGAIGGAVRVAFGLITCYVLNGILFIGALMLSIWLLWFPDLNPPKPADFPTKPIPMMKHSLKELIAGFKLLFSGKGYLLSFVVMKLLGSSVWASIEFINVKLSELPMLSLFNNGEQGIQMTNTIAYCLFGIGSGLAPMLFELFFGNRIRRSLRSAFWTRVVILASFFAISMGFLLMCFTYHASMFIIANCILGSAGGVMWVYSMSAIEHLTPNHYLGRITAFDICFGFGLGQAIGVMIPSPLLYDIIGIKVPHIFAIVMFVLSWMLFCLTIVWFYFTRKIHQHFVVHDDDHH